MLLFRIAQRRQWLNIVMHFPCGSQNMVFHCLARWVKCSNVNQQSPESLSFCWGWGHQTAWAISGSCLSVFGPRYLPMFYRYSTGQLALSTSTTSWCFLQTSTNTSDSLKQFCKQSRPPDSPWSQKSAVSHLASCCSWATSWACLDFAPTREKRLPSPPFRHPRTKRLCIDFLACAHITGGS